MAVDQGLIQIFTTDFQARCDLALQQPRSLLRGTTDEKSGYVGKQASPLNLIEPFTSVGPAGRFANKNYQPTDFIRRWVMPQDGEIETLWDNFDQVRTLVEPKSKAPEAYAAAAGRAWDDCIMAAATAASPIGTDEGSMSTEPFTSTFQIAANFGASAATGMTVAKLIEARRIMRHYHVDFMTDEAYVVIGSQQESDLLKQTQVTSKDYNPDFVLTEGKLTKYVGWNIIVSERVPQTTVNTTRGCIAYVKSGIHLGFWQDLKIQVFQDFTKTSNPWNVSGIHTFGATRTQLGKVVQILCADTTGGDITP
jgi:hypothetical protein